MYMLKDKQLYRKQCTCDIYIFISQTSDSFSFFTFFFKVIFSVIKFEDVQLTCFTLDLAGSSTGGHVLVPELTERTLTGDSHPVLHLHSLITLEELVAIGVVFLVSDAIYNFRICTDIWKNLHYFLV